MHYPFKVGYLGSSPSGVTILTQKKKKQCVTRKKKEGISQGEKSFTVVSTFNKEVLK